MIATQPFLATATIVIIVQSFDRVDLQLRPFFNPILMLDLLTILEFLVTIAIMYMLQINFLETMMRTPPRLPPAKRVTTDV